MKTIQEIMVKSPKYCDKNETVQSAIERLSNANIGSLPVLDENKKVVGMVTDRDICLSLGKDSKKSASEIKIQDIIKNKEVHTCLPDDNIQTALKIMRTKQVGRVPVVDKDRNLKGIVTLGHILNETRGSNEEAQIQYAGEENIIKTLHAISDRKTEAIF
ncbi:MAG: CBS domain-containing protein [Bacteroidetes bacterium]|nr:CBS domain-containing protein [Bacteroidota bacterium]